MIPIFRAPWLPVFYGLCSLHLRGRQYHHFNSPESCTPSYSWRSINTLGLRAARLVDDLLQARVFLPPPLIDMADQRPAQTAKESKGFCNRLKKMFRGSHSTPPIHTDSPPAVVAVPAVIASPAAIAAPPVVAVPPADPLPLSADPLPPSADPLPPSADPLPLIAASPTDPVPAAPMITTDPEEAAKLRAKYTHFRILVIGRANAGKTTLLKRVCNTKEDPVYSKVMYPLLLMTRSHRRFSDRLTPPQRYEFGDPCI